MQVDPHGLDPFTPPRRGLRTDARRAVRPRSAAVRGRPADPTDARARSARLAVIERNVRTDSADRRVRLLPRRHQIACGWFSSAGSPSSTSAVSWACTACRSSRSAARAMVCQRSSRGSSTTRVSNRSRPSRWPSWKCTSATVSRSSPVRAPSARWSDAAYAAGSAAIAMASSSGTRPPGSAFSRCSHGLLVPTAEDLRQRVLDGLDARRPAGSTASPMSIGRRRLLISQRVARSTSVRTSIRSWVCTWASIWWSSALIASSSALGAEDGPGGDLRPDHVGLGGAGLRGQPVEAGDAGLVDELVDHDGGDDLPVQPVLGHPIGVALAQPAREVADQPVGQVRIVGQIGRAGSRPRGRSWCRRAGWPAPARSAPCGWSAGPPSRRSRAGTRSPGRADPGRPAAPSSPRARRPSTATGRRCWPAPGSGRSCGPARAGRPRRSSRPATRPVRSIDSRPAATSPVSRILMLTSWSEVSTPAELSMKSVLIRPPLAAYSIRPSWVSPRLPPSPTHLARSSAPLTRSPSLALSPTWAWVSPVALT